jgi:hypothetical protein
MDNNNDLIEFIIESSNESISNVQEDMESLINQLTTRGWHDNHRDNLYNLITNGNNYNCFQQINIEKKSIESDESKVILIGAIEYFN